MTPPLTIRPYDERLGCCLTAFSALDACFWTDLISAAQVCPT